MWTKIQQNFRIAFAERLVILILLVKRCTSSMNEINKTNIVNKTSDCEGVLNKGIKHLSSFESCIEASALHKWDDYLGSLHADDHNKRCFGPFLFLNHEIIYDKKDEEETLQMYSTLGSAIHYGHDNYRIVKQQFLNGMVLRKREGGLKLIQPLEVKGNVALVASTMTTGFREATFHVPNNRDLTDDFIKVNRVVKEKMLSVVCKFAGENAIDFQQPLLGENQTKFLIEANRFLGKFVWMVLQHIQSFPHMQGSKEYIKKQMTNKSQVSSGNNKSNDNQKHELKEAILKQWDEYFQYDPFNCVWTYIEGVLPVTAHYLCIGDIIKLTFRPYFHE